MELPKGTISVRNLAYLALDENDQIFYESRICEMRYVSNHVACLLFFVFLRRLVVPRTEHRCEGTPLFFSAPGGRGLCVDRAWKGNGIRLMS